MSTVVIMPGGFHPFHAGHAALYQSAVKAFPDADVYVAATDDTSERPFPFAIKEKLARVAGIPPGRFVKVKSPFSSEEITSKYDPNKTVLIFVKSEKNAKGGSDPEGPFPAEVDPTTGKLPLVTRGARKGQPVSDRLQYYKGNENNLQPMSRHSYLAYLPTVEFGPGIKSGSELRSLWPKIDDRRKTAFVMSMYPATQKNPKLATNVVKMIDMGMGGQQGVAEGLSKRDQQDVAAIRAAIARLESQLNHPNADKAAIQQSIAHEKKRLALYGQGVAEAEIDRPGMKDGRPYSDPYRRHPGNSSYMTPEYLIQKYKERLEQIAAGPYKRPKEVAQLQSRIAKLEKKGVAEGSAESSASSLQGQSNPKVDLTPNFPNYQVLVGEFIGAKGGKLLLRIVDAQLRPGVKETEKIAKAISNNRPIMMAPNYVKNRIVVGEGEVIPFARKPQPKLTWQQVPKDVLLLANDWFWADEDDMGLDAVLDPKGYGNGTANDVRYIAAKLQQKGWTIEHDLEDNRPGQFNMKLTNNRGQSVLLPWEDAQDFKGWAAGTRPSMSEGDENQYRRPSSGEVARVSQQTQAKLNPVRSQFVWKKPNQIGGSFSEQDLLAKGFKKSQYNSWGGTQQMWDRLSGVKEARVLFTNPNTKVNVYYNSRNPKYLGKPVQVGKEIPYNKIDKFIDMIVSKYQVKPTEFMWTDSSRDRTDAHIVHEIKDYLEEK